MSTTQMFPPSNGSRNSVTVSGRTYVAIPDIPVPVATSDVPALQANGWTTNPVSAATGNLGETWAGTLRRLGSAARTAGGNIFNIAPSQYLIGAIPWTASTAMVVPSTAVQNNVYAAIPSQINDGFSNVYECIVAGVTGFSTPFAAPAYGAPTPFTVVEGAAGGIVVTITDASPAVITWAGGTAPANQMPFVLYTTGTLPAPLATGTVYYVSNPSGTTSSISATAGGAAINTTTAGSGTQTAGGNAVWKYIGKQTAPTIHMNTSNQNYPNSVAATVSLTDGGVPWRYSGGVPYEYSPGNGHTYVVPISATNGFGTLGSGGTNLPLPNTVSPGFSWEFDFDGSLLQFATYYDYATLIIEIDGVPIYPPLGVSQASGFHYMDFTPVVTQKGGWSQWEKGRAQKRLKITSRNDVGLRYLSWEATANVTYPSIGPDNFSLAIVGDSQSMGYVDTLTGLDLYGQQVARRLGIPDCVICGWPGTGYLATDGLTNGNYIGRAISDLQVLNAFRPINYIYVQSSSNDNSGSPYTPAQVGAAALQFYQALRAEFATTPIFVGGILVLSGETAGDSAAAETAIAAAVAQQQAAGDGLIWYFPIATSTSQAAPFFTGTGNMTYPTGSGNSDWDAATDYVHMNSRGHAVYAKWLADQIWTVAQRYP